MLRPRTLGQHYGIFFRGRACHGATIGSCQVRIVPRAVARYYGTKPSPRSGHGSRRRFLAVLAVTAPIAAYSLYQAYELSSFGEQRALNPQTFTPYTLQSREDISPTLAVFTFRPQHSSSLSAALWPCNHFQSIELKHPALQIARRYTPLPPPPGAEAAAGSELRFLIRKDTGGEVSSYIHNLPVAAEVELRGTLEDAALDLGQELDDVVVLAGGTGVATALQTLATVLPPQAERSVKTRVLVVWAIRDEKECHGIDLSLLAQRKSRLGWPLSTGSAGKTITLDKDSANSSTSSVIRDLLAWQNAFQGEVEVRVLIDSDKVYMSPTELRQALHTFKNGPFAAQAARKLVIVSGPDPFVRYVSGAKEWAGGGEVQGRLGGLLKQLKIDQDGWQVFKA